MPSFTDTQAFSVCLAQAVIFFGLLRFAVVVPLSPTLKYFPGCKTVSGERASESVTASYSVCVAASELLHIHLCGYFSGFCQETLANSCISCEIQAFSFLIRLNGPHKWVMVGFTSGNWSDNLERKCNSWWGRLCLVEARSLQCLSKLEKYYLLIVGVVNLFMSWDFRGAYRSTIPMIFT